MHASVAAHAFGVRPWLRAESGCNRPKLNHSLHITSPNRTRSICLSCTVLTTFVKRSSHFQCSKVYWPRWSVCQFLMTPHWTRVASKPSNMKGTRYASWVKMKLKPSSLWVNHVALHLMTCWSMLKSSRWISWMHLEGERDVPSPNSTTANPAFDANHGQNRWRGSGGSCNSAAAQRRKAFRVISINFTHQ